MSIIDQLVEVYNQETWHSERMSDEEARYYHTQMFNRGAIQCTTEEDILLGYIEVWRLTFEQLGRYICTGQIYSLQENVYTGPVAFLANTWIRPDKRGSWVHRDLKKKFMEKHGLCPYYFSSRKPKYPSAPFKIHKRIRRLGLNECR